MFIHKPSPETFDRVTQKVLRWLTIHNLPLWSILVAWSCISLPSIATSFFKLPLAIVLLLSGGGLAGIVWMIRENPIDKTDGGTGGHLSQSVIQTQCEQNPDSDVEPSNFHLHNLDLESQPESEDEVTVDQQENLDSVEFEQLEEIDEDEGCTEYGDRITAEGIPDFSESALSEDEVSSLEDDSNDYKLNDEESSFDTLPLTRRV